MPIWLRQREIAADLQVRNLLGDIAKNQPDGAGVGQSESCLPYCKTYRLADAA